MALFVTNLLTVAFFAAYALIIGRVLISWVDPIGRTAVGSFLIAATEPILAPVRRVLPQTGVMDFSPLVVLIVLGILSSVILRPG